MQIRFIRIIFIALAVELLAILVLVSLVAALGPADPEAAQAYAQRLGYWVGPVAGFLLTLIGGWLAARGLERRHLLNGFVLGAAVAAIDIFLLVASESGFQPIFAISNIGRLIAGSAGGGLAGIRTDSN